MHIHILGICGTFMGSLAVLARELGHEVTGSDANVYPPMSTQLQEQGIEIQEGYDPSHLEPSPDLVIVGNAMSRGNPAIEAVLSRQIPYTSGPQWLCEQVLQHRHVLAVSGTHGKTTTTSMLTWVLEYAGLKPGYLVGGVPQNFDVSARLGDSDYFVIEADEYDSAFFDKRSKFVHYRPKTLIINNLEFDHADIFDDLAAIQRQFHHVVRTVPADGLVLTPKQEDIEAVLAMGCWTPVEYLMNDGEGWGYKLLKDDGSHFAVSYNGEQQGEVQWTQTGLHSVANGLAAIAAANHINIAPAKAIEALNAFVGVKRRMELLADVDGVKVYDDFAHHPTAIATTLQGLRANVADEKIIAVIEPRSNTMRMGCHQDALSQSVKDADQVIWYQPPELDWNLETVVSGSSVPSKVASSINSIVNELIDNSSAGQHIILMSNGGFGGIHQQLVQSLKEK